MNKDESAGKTIELDLDNGERFTISGEQLGEPDKALVVERALQLAALESRSGAPETQDFERAAQELSADARVMDRGGSVDADSPGPVAGEGSAQVLNQEDDGKNRRS